MVAKGVNQFDMAYIADFFFFLYKAQPDQFIAYLDIVSPDSQKAMEATIKKLWQKVKTNCQSKTKLQVNTF